MSSQEIDHRRALTGKHNKLPSIRLVSGGSRVTRVHMQYGYLLSTMYQYTLFSVPRVR